MTFSQAVEPELEALTRLLIGIYARYRKDLIDGESMYKLAQTIAKTMREVPKLREGQRDAATVEDLEEDVFVDLMADTVSQQEKGLMSDKAVNWELFALKMIVAGIRRLHKEARVEEDIVIRHISVDAITGETKQIRPPIRVRKSGGRWTQLD